jgi:photosystem II stability/assembly factor-like uncharacterized protein
MRRKLVVVATVAMTLMLAVSTSSARTSTAIRPTTAVQLVAQTVVEARVTPTAVTGAAGYFWLLGTYPCSTGTCPVLMRSTNGGQSWVRVGSPPSSVDAIDFANREDGYAYFRGSYDERATFYWTGNGGRTWRLVPLRFPESRSPSIVIASGRAYLLVPENCLANGECRSQALASSAVTSDVWTTKPLRLPVGEAIQPVGLAVFGSKVWTIAIGAAGGAVLSVSSDGGRSFASLPSTGMLGLACNATATSALTLWGFCATGSLGYAVRSTDGGRDFATLSGWNRGHRPAANGGSILPLSNDEAIFQPGGPSMWLTRDNGRHFSAVHFSSLWQSPNYGFSIAFASTTNWLVLGIQDPSGPNLMWRTTNSGRSWQPVKAPSVTTATGGEGTVTGTFVAVGGAAPGLPRPLPGQVTAANTAGRKFTVTVGKSGRFVLSLPAGVYRLTGRSPMFSVNGAEGTCAADQPVRVRAGKKTLGVEVVCPLK